MLNKNRALRDGRYPLVFQLIHRRRKKLIYTPYKLSEEEFCDNTGRVKYRSARTNTRKQVQEMNLFLHGKREEIDALLVRMEMSQPGFAIEDFMKAYDRYQSDNYLFTFAERLVADLRNAGRHGTAAAYQSTLRSFGEFAGGDKLRFTELDHKFVREYQQFLIIRGVASNTVCFYLRNLRSLYNLAAGEGVEVPVSYPFQNIPIRIGKTVKRALSRENLSRIARYDLTDAPDLTLARDLFMFSYYTRGMSFVDIVCLKKKNISEGVISYSRSKTHQHLQIAVTEPLQQLIDRYGNDSEYVFPLMASGIGETGYARYRSALGHINRRLKKLGTRLGISIPLTTYVARHSWATVAKEIGAPVAVISEGLGHTTEKTTQIYLRSFDRAVIDRVNEEVSRLL